MINETTKMTFKAKNCRDICITIPKRILLTNICITIPPETKIAKNATLPIPRQACKEGGKSAIGWITHLMQVKGYKKELHMRNLQEDER